MRKPHRFPAVLSLCLSLFACGAGTIPDACDGCAAVEKPCTLDRDCAAGLVCNSALQACSECAFDSQCAGKPGTPACDPDTGTCVACNLDVDCLKALGPGSVCDGHACAPQDKTPCEGDGCPECSCATPSDDGTWCDDPACGAGKVCDAATSICRKKRQNERCVSSAECGDLGDPTIGACIPAAACIYGWHDLGTSGTCGAGAYGRCGVACDDLQQDLCTGSIPCPAGSRCRPASTDAGAGTFCVSASCTK